MCFKFLKVCIFIKFSTFFISLSTKWLQLLIFLTVRCFSLLGIIFQSRKGTIWLKNVSSWDSITIDLWNSVIISLWIGFREGSFEDLFVFAMYVALFTRWSCTPPPTMVSNFCWEFTKRDTHSPWLRQGYIGLHTCVKRGITNTC